MSQRIKVADLPEFDAGHYLGSEKAVAAYLADILEASDAAFVAAALRDTLIMKLTKRDKIALVEALLHAPAPNARLQKAAARHAALVALFDAPPQPN